MTMKFFAAVLASGVSATALYAPNACAQTGERNGFAGYLAISIFAFLDPAQCGIDLCDKLALAIARAEFNAPIGFA